MACQIGITTAPDRRRAEWQARYATLRNWRILGNYTSRTAAQAAENQLSRQQGCGARAGGDGPEHATWYVYRFDY